MSGIIKNVFISHIHKDDDLVLDMKNNINDSGRCIVRDSSITDSKPNNAKNENYIKYSILSPGIKWASVLVVIISPKTKTSWWVNWEIEHAYRLGKRIVGIYADGALGTDVPFAFEKYGNALVGWRTGRAIDAIEGKVNNFENPDGSKWTVGPNIKRFSCS